MDAFPVLVASADPKLRARLRRALGSSRAQPVESLAALALRLAEQPETRVLLWDAAPAGDLNLEALEAIRRVRSDLSVVVLEEGGGGPSRFSRLDIGSIQILRKPVGGALLLSALAEAARRAAALPGGRAKVVDSAVLSHYLYRLATVDQAFEHLPVAALVVDKKGVILGINREARLLTGASSSTVGRARCRELCGCALREEDCPLRGAMAFHKPVHRAEIPVELGRRRRVFVERISPFHDPATGEERAVISLGDATAHLRMLDRLRVQARTDPLTGVASRSRFEDHWRRIARIERRHKPSALLMIDLDGLKAVNDRWGHSGGDHLLFRLGQLLLRETRDQDLVARLGGDEFAVFCPSTDAGEAERLAIRIRRAAEEDNAHYAGHPSLRVSLGCASTDRCAPEALREEADKALYADKAQRHSS